jgi:hypothetical protein
MSRVKALEKLVELIEREKELVGEREIKCGMMDSGEIVLCKLMNLYSKADLAYRAHRCKWCLFKNCKDKHALTIACNEARELLNTHSLRIKECNYEQKKTWTELLELRIVIALVKHI